MLSQERTPATNFIQLRTMSDLRLALASVHDPECGEPITALGLILECVVEDTCATIRLRMPDRFSSTSLARLIGYDVWAAAQEVPGLSEVRIELSNHHDAEAVTAWLRDGDVGLRGLPEELLQLRSRLLGKLHLAAMERCCALALASGIAGPADLHLLVLGDLPEGHCRDTLVRRRREVGLTVHRQARVVVDDEGLALPPASTWMRLHVARSARISLDRSLARRRRQAADAGTLCTHGVRDSDEEAPLAATGA